MSLTNLVTVMQQERAYSAADRDGLLKSLETAFDALRAQINDSFAARDNQLAAIIGADEPQEQQMQEAAE